MKTQMKIFIILLILCSGYADAQFYGYNSMAHASWHMGITELGRIDKFELITYVTFNDELCNQKLLENGTYGKIPFDEADYTYLYFTYQDGSSRLIDFDKYEYRKFLYNIRTYRNLNRNYY